MEQCVTERCFVNLCLFLSRVFVCCLLLQKVAWQHYLNWDALLLVCMWKHMLICFHFLGKWFSSRLSEKKHPRSHLPKWRLNNDSPATEITVEVNVWKIQCQTYCGILSDVESKKDLGLQLGLLCPCPEDIVCHAPSPEQWSYSVCIASARLRSHWLLKFMWEHRRNNR